jgi:hypothetical protein
MAAHADCNMTILSRYLTAPGDRGTSHVCPIGVATDTRLVLKLLPVNVESDMDDMGFT